MSRALGTSKYRGMVRVVIDHLVKGKSITAVEAFYLWGEPNVRNKISALRKDKWNILSKKVSKQKDNGFYRYYLNMEHPRGGEDE